jgi:hypothetical protein
VLLVRVDYHVVPVEPDAIEAPRMPCPVCTTRTGRHKGHVTDDDHVCPRCGNTRIVGVPVPHHAILVNWETGAARHWTRTTKRKQGDGLYQPHVCAGGGWIPAA